MDEKGELTVDDFVEQKFPIECSGRDSTGSFVLKEPVNVTVEIYKIPGSDIISSNVDCPYNTGGHGERCKASHPDVDKVGEGIRCPYSFDLPYALGFCEVDVIEEVKINWVTPSCSATSARFFVPSRLISMFNRSLSLLRRAAR